MKLLSFMWVASPVPSTLKSSRTLRRALEIWRTVWPFFLDLFFSSSDSHLLSFLCHVAMCSSILWCLLCCILLYCVLCFVCVMWCVVVLVVVLLCYCAIVLLYCAIVLLFVLCVIVLLCYCVVLWSGSVMPPRQCLVEYRTPQEAQALIAHSATNGIVIGGCKLNVSKSKSLSINNTRTSEGSNLRMIDYFFFFCFISHSHFFSVHTSQPQTRFCCVLSTTRFTWSLSTRCSPWCLLSEQCSASSSSARQACKHLSNLKMCKAQQQQRLHSTEETFTQEDAH